MKPNMFHGQVAIVTGASSGIGRAIAVQLSHAGAKVIIAARRAERLELVAAEIRQHGGEVLAVPTDVSDEAQCKALVEKTIVSFNRLDMLVNNAGMAASALFDEYPNLDLFRLTVDINFYGAVYCTYYALPYLKQAKGRILAVSSLGGKASVPYNTPYCASKFALDGFYDSLRMELAPHGVTITVVYPWWVATEFHEAQLDKNGVPRGSRGRSYYTRKTMTAEQCARVALKAAQTRRREVLMGPGILATWLKVLAPRVLDWLVYKVFLEPAIRRAKAGQILVKS